MLSFYYLSLHCTLSQILLFQPIVIICKLHQVPVCYGVLLFRYNVLKPCFFSLSFFFVCFPLDTAY